MVFRASCRSIMGRKTRSISTESRGEVTYKQVDSGATLEGETVVPGDEGNNPQQQLNLSVVLALSVHVIYISFGTVICQVGSSLPPLASSLLPVPSAY